jgi:hypothetical protein
MLFEVKDTNGLRIEVEPSDLIDPTYWRGYDAAEIVTKHRIIELLESYKCPCYCEVHSVIDYVVSRLKGENK